MFIAIEAKAREVREKGFCTLPDHLPRALMEECNQAFAPTDILSDFAEPARLITLIQAIPLSLGPERLERFKAGERIPLRELNPAQRATGRHHALSC